MLGLAPHIVWLQSSLRREEDFRHFFSSQMSGSCQKLGEDGERALSLHKQKVLPPEKWAEKDEIIINPHSENNLKG